MSPLTILRAGLDTVELSFVGLVHPKVISDLEKLKIEAQQANIGLPYFVGASEFFLQPKGRGVWRYILASRDFDLRISLGDDEKMPSASIRLNAFGLATIDPTKLYEYAVLCLEELGRVEELGVSRADVAVDEQGWVPTVDEMRNMVCAASFRPVYPNTEHPDTFQYGKGQRVLRLYNKTKKCEKYPEDRWWLPIWEECPGYVPGEPVIRIEGQARRQALREVGIESAEQLLSDPMALFEWMLRDYANLRESVPGRKKGDCPEHPVWAALRSATATGRTLTHVRRPARLLELDRTLSRAVGIAAIYAAYHGLDSFEDAMDGLKRECREHKNERVRGFIGLVEDNRRRLMLD